MKQFKFRRALCLFLCLVMVAAVLVGCKKTDGGNTDSGAPSDNHTGAEPPSDNHTGTEPPSDTSETAGVIPTDKLSELRIIYHEGASDAIIAAAQELAATIGSLYGLSITVNSDRIREGSTIYCEVKYEIILGETDRVIETDFYDTILAEDYVYTSVGTKILVCGGTEYATLAAISAFSYNVIIKKDKIEGVFYSPEFNKIEKGTYMVDHLTLNGAPIKDYSVVYPDASAEYEKELALRVAEVIERMTGYLPAVKSDREAYADSYEILVGRTNRAPELTVSEPEGITGYVGGSDKLIALWGSTMQGHSIAVEHFLAKIKNAAADGKEVSLTIGEPETANGDGALSIMSYNLQGWDTSTSRTDRVLGMIRQYLPDIFGTQEGTSFWMSVLENNLSSYYSFVGEGREGGLLGEYCAIFYAKERFEVLDSDTVWFSGTEGAKEESAGYIRIYTWAKFRDLTTGEVFLFVNTHLDTADDTVRGAEVEKLLRFLKDYKDIPVILTGDMNCYETSTPIQILLGTSFESIFEATDNKSGTPGIDWIFTTEEGITVKQARLCDERIYGDYTSDHFPVFAEVVITLPEEGIENNWDKVYPRSPEGYLQPDNDKEGTDYGPINSFDAFLPPTAPPTEEPDSGTEGDTGDGTDDGTTGDETVTEPPDGELGIVEDTDGESYQPIIPF